MSKYEQAGQHFYSESLDVLVKTLGAIGELGTVLHVIYSGNEAYANPLMEASETFLDKNFVSCQYDYEKNEVSFEGEDDGSSASE